MALLRRFFVFISIFCMSSMSLADLDSGYAWLSKQQQVDGGVYLSEDIADQYQSTAVALLAFTDAGRPFELSHPDVLQYLSQRIYWDAEVLSLAIQAGLQQDMLGQTLLYKLKNLMNANGGFGSQEGFESTVLDTVLALEALTVVAPTELEIIAGAIGFLQSKQRADGGYSYTFDGESSVLLSARVSLILQSFAFKFDVAGTQHKLAEYLLSQRNDEGYWDSDWYSAQAIGSLILQGVDRTVLDGAIQKLVVAQSIDGSWSHDVYITSQVLRALYRVENFQQPSQPTTGTVIGEILHASNQTPLSGVNVTAVELPDSGTASSGTGHFTLGELDPGSYQLEYRLVGFLTASQAIEVVAGSTLSVGVVKLQPLPNKGVVSGQITSADTGLPITGARIDLGDNSVFSDSNGSYQFISMPGDLSISVTVAGYNSVTVNAVAVAGQILHFSPALVKPTEPPTVHNAILRGVVIDADSELPLDGVTVSLAHSSRHFVTTASGAFTIDDIAAQSLAITLSKPGYTAQQYSAVAIAGNVIDLKTVALKLETFAPTTSVVGYVNNRHNSTAIVGARVVLEQTGQQVLTDSNGYYQFSNVELARFSLFVSSENYWSQRNTLSIAEPHKLRFDWVLDNKSSGEILVPSLQLDKAQYSAFEPLQISAQILSSEVVARRAKVMVEVQTAAGEPITSFSLGGGISAGAGIDDYITLLADEPVDLQGEWFTGITEPGIYQLQLNVYDAFSAHLLAQELVHFNVQPTQKIKSLSLKLSPTFSHVDADEHVEIVAELVYQSNQTIELALDVSLLDVNGSHIQQLHPTLQLPAEKQLFRKVLASFPYKFLESGHYSVTADVTSGPQPAAVNSNAIEVAPTVRLDIQQGLDESVLIPGEDHKVRVEINIQGMGQ